MESDLQPPIESLCVSLHYELVAGVKNIDIAKAERWVRGIASASDTRENKGTCPWSGATITPYGEACQHVGGLVAAVKATPRK